MNRQTIEDAIPHRGPMLLVDEIIECEDNHIICRKTFRDDEFFFQGHYPGFPLVPGVILCECAMQAGGILLAKMLDGAEGVPVAGVGGWEAFCQLHRNDHGPVRPQVADPKGR